MILTCTTKHEAKRTMKLQILYSVVSVLAFAKVDEVSDRGNCWDETLVSAGLLISGVKEIVDVWTPIMHEKRVAEP